MQKSINVLVDADSIFFRIAYSNPKKDLKKMYRKFCREMEANVQGQFDTFDNTWNVFYAVKGKGNFRKDLYPAYKSKRPELEEDLKEKLNYIWKYSIKEGAIAADGMEADDLVSIWASESRKNGEDYIICGIDKDLKQIPGNHYNYNKKEFSFVDDDQARKNLMIQALTGDNTDGIPGLKGVGPKTAEKLLKDIKPSKMWSKVVSVWQEHGKSKTEAELSLRLLTMLTSFEELDNVRQSMPEKLLQIEALLSEQYDLQEQSDQAEDVC